MKKRVVGHTLEEPGSERADGGAWEPIQTEHAQDGAERAKRTPPRT
jgi:hypothetical protein